MLTDPIADMLTRIRNANLALHDTVEMPGSSLKADIARVLEEQGYIAGFETSADGSRSTLIVKLKYDEDRRRARPRHRVLDDERIGHVPVVREVVPSA
jgi:small subunit ribosomal protein S8